MKLFLKSILLSIGVLQLQGCCEYIDESLCFDQVFTESAQLPLRFTYQINTNKPFIESKKITTQDIINALKENGDNLKVKKVEVTSAKISYIKDPANISKSLLINFGITKSNGGAEILLLKESRELSLTSPEAGGVGIPMNQYLNSQGIGELKKYVMEFATSVNTGEISVNLKGEGLPSSSLTKFSLQFDLEFSITYEICHYAPMGEGERDCE